MPADGELLRRYQQALLRALHEEADGEAVRERLLADDALMPLHGWIAAFQPRMLELGGEIVRRWSKPDP